MKSIFVITAIIILTAASATAGNIVSCAGVGDCNINYFRSDVPAFMEGYNIRIVEKKDPIPESNIVEFEFDKETFSIVCDGAWNDIPTGKAVKNRMSCEVDKGMNIMSGTAVTVNMIVYDQDAATYNHITRPSDDYPELAGTSETTPYCETDTFGKACKWQLQNTNIPLLNMQGVPLNNWIVMTRTNVTDLRLGYTIDDMPFETGKKYCYKDLNSNTNIDMGEFWECLNGTPESVCPEDAKDCVPKEPANCTKGGLNTSRDRCVDAPLCPAPGGYEASRDRCETPTTESCTKPIPPATPICTEICPAGYNKIKMGLGSICVTEPFCEVGGILKGDPAPMPPAPAGSRYCDFGAPECVPPGEPNPTNLIYNELHDACYIDGFPCPYGDGFKCVVPDGFTDAICSPNACGSVEDEGTPMGADDKVGDGTIDADGNCLDHIYIFSGHDERCRSGGINLGLESCCANKSTFFGLFKCREHERQLAELREQELCIQVGGEYCSKKISFIGFSVCVEKKNTYCCFDSLMAKTINEQGRKQLKTIDFGTAKKPNCRGFTPEEFQALDFSEDKIDLSTWYKNLKTNSNAEINTKISNRINKFYNEIK